MREAATHHVCSSLTDGLHWNPWSACYWAGGYIPHYPTTHSSQNPVIMTISPPLHGNKGQRSPKWRRRSRNREQECLALADVQRERERELICQLSQLKQSIRDLVYHIRACKTSVSQHGCPLLLIFFFLTSGLLTSSSALETDERTCNDLHMP